MTLSELIEKCKANHSKSQCELYTLYKSRLMGICRRYASSREEAQDILQETFIKIFKNINQLESVISLESWMIKITINTALNFYHRNKKHDAYNLEIHDHGGNDYEVMLSHISDQFLLKLINELPEGCRHVFNLNAVEGYSHSEIADLLQISESTSRSQLNYAKNILKAKLKSVGVIRYEKYA